MNFAINRDHRDFFRKHQWIELEELLTHDQRESLLHEITHVLSERLKRSVTDIHKIRSNELFEVGRDLWRSSAVLKKHFLHKKFAEIVSQLIEVKPLRFGYDQLFVPPATSLSKNPYADFLDLTPALQDVSCIQGVLCGLMLCLSQPYNSFTDALEPASGIFSTKANNGIVFMPDMPIPLDQIRKRSGGVYMMLVYTKSNAVYYLQEKDPHTHDFKQFGYNFGDRLSEKLNPLVYV